MIMIDTSAWIEFLRDTQSDVCEAVSAALDADIAVLRASPRPYLRAAEGEVPSADSPGKVLTHTKVPWTLWNCQLLSKIRFTKIR